VPDPLQFGLGPGYGFGGRLPYLVAILLVGIGLTVLIDDADLLKKVVGLGVFQTGIFLFFVASAVRTGGRSPTLSGPGPYVNPLPQVLILTAIVVGVSVTGVALALVVRLHDEFGTLDAEAIRDATEGQTRRGGGTEKRQARRGGDTGERQARRGGDVDRD
jgi:multicomponent Na+:H+ antiporter subunit C